MLLVKLFALAFVVGDVAFSRQMPEEVLKLWLELIEPYSDECIKETNPEPKDLDAIIHHGFLPMSPGVICYVNCLYERTGILKSNGEVHIDHMMSLLSYMTHELSHMCTAEAEWYKGSDMCEKAYVLGNCVIHALSV
ncbi:hypothetical protein FQR65_LT09866 [Abscondita terminalis]|nr:hypothetical protein FQR65_LT09866 [Abscondita terminalis]